MESKLVWVQGVPLTTPPHCASMFSAFRPPVCGARFVCLTEPERGDVLGARGTWVPRSKEPIAMEEPGMDQRSEGPWCCYLKRRLSVYRVSFCSEPPASVPVHTPAGLRANCAKVEGVLSWRFCHFYYMTHPFSTFPWTTDLLCFLF